MNSSERTSIGAAVGKVPSGCAIVTTVADGQRAALLASWIQQASFEPLMLTVCVKKGRPIESAIDASGAFVINVIGQDAKPMFKRFGKPPAEGIDPFEGIANHECPQGVVLDDCPAHIACRVAAKYDGGDHWIYLGEALAGDADAAAPYVHLRATGLDY